MKDYKYQMKETSQILNYHIKNIAQKMHKSLYLFKDEMFSF